VERGRNKGKFGFHDLDPAIITTNDDDSISIVVSARECQGGSSPNYFTLKGPSRDHKIAGVGGSVRGERDLEWLNI
jgi:hypothetical protein